MTNEQMFEELIELAENNGYRFFSVDKKHLKFAESEMVWQYKKGHAYYASLMDILFDLDFGTAIFGNEIVENIPPVIKDGKVIAQAKGLYVNRGWQYHLQQLAITEPEDRIKYAWENRRK